MAPGGSVDALEGVGEGDGDAGDDEISVTGSAGAGAVVVDTFVTEVVAVVGDGDAAGGVDTVVTEVVAGVGVVGATSTGGFAAVLSSGESSLLLDGLLERRRCREASGTGVDVVGVVAASSRGVAGGSPGLRRRRRRGA